MPSRYYNLSLTKASDYFKNRIPIVFSIFVEVSKKQCGAHQEMAQTGGGDRYRFHGGNVPKRQLSNRQTWEQEEEG